MPAVVALILRQIIMSLATGAIVTGVQEALDGTIKELVFEIKDTEGVTEQDAKDIVANILVDLLINSVTIFTVLKTGAGVKAAEYLGLTSRGYAKKALIYPASSAAARVAGESGVAIAKKVIPKIIKIAAVPGALIWLASALANIIEPGIYKPEQTNAVYKKLGIPFQYPMPEGQLKPGPFSTSSSVTFADFAKSIETAGVRGIEDPIALQSRVYSRQALADLIDGIYGREVLNGNAPSVKQLLPLLTPYLVGGNFASSPVVSSSPVGSIAPVTKVFTGIVSQGVVGQGLNFTPRPDDMIESVEELRQAAANNLAPYLNALLGKIVYEVKVIPSIITKEGFKQTGTTQKIQSGSYADGTPKYKMVTNKFATLNVYALTDKGSRAKLTTIVLGPTNSAKLTVSQADVRAIETALPKDVTTTDINDISGIETANPITVSTPPAAQPVQQQEEQEAYWLTLYISGKKYQVGPFDDKSSAKAVSSSIEKLYSKVKINVNYDLEKRLEPGLPTWTGDDLKDKVKSASVSDAIPVVTKPATSTPTKGASASTLSEWYQAQGQSLPSVKERAKIYATLGLGQESYYTGTAEQNTKLLKALKEK